MSSGQLLYVLAIPACDPRTVSGGAAHHVPRGLCKPMQVGLLPYHDADDATLNEA
eukprot:CAMPEP_0180638328 /NCGR_PEP_ID=MMETSP1037_2-20121125/44258_1 /TAXON_ID=632150 /ORGANISM="Azadinium spinosum, Strain 3D9" /LENGTH=54 /DNA_ID=CAMNT_0022659833 /DNA_START=8 /DNA_END=169 /DNA_ORIENTATION=-